MKIRNQRDFGAGIMYMVIGLFFTVVATQYPMGTPAKMGPGYFPHYLGILMTLLGLFITIKSFSAKAAIESIPKFNWKIMAQITGVSRRSCEYWLALDRAPSGLPAIRLVAAVRAHLEVRLRTLDEIDKSLG